MTSPTPYLLASTWAERFLESIFSPSYNLLSIYLGVPALGLAAGICGCFLLFRKRSLLSDTVGHATLPGVAIAFLLVARFGEGGKSFALSMVGALITGWLSVRAVRWMREKTKIREDAALAISLTVFYGFGVIVLSVIQDPALKLKESSGLEYYLFGMVASMVRSEAWILFGVAILSLVVVFVFFKELNSLCFDEAFVASQGLPHRWMDEVLMLTCLSVTIVGLQTVGLLLIMAMFIIPPATARLWTQSMPLTLVIAGFVGLSGALIGAMLSATAPKLPAGASIILATATLFGLSMLFGARKGWLVRKISLARLERRLSENQFLRGIFDSLESQQQVRLLAGLDFSRDLAHVEVPMASFLDKRAWSKSKQTRIARSLKQKRLLDLNQSEKVRLTDAGLDRAIESARTHRLTELYLLEHAEIAPAKVHQYVERIEEITTPDIASDLRKIFAERLRKQLMPPEPHTRT